MHRCSRSAIAANTADTDRCNTADAYCTLLLPLAHQRGASKLGLLAEELAPDQPWADIRGIDNWLRHDYPKVIKDTIWKTVTDDLSSLLGDCEVAIRELAHRRQQAPGSH